MDQTSGLESSDKDYSCAQYNHSRSFGERVLTSINFLRSSFDVHKTAHTVFVYSEKI